MLAKPKKWLILVGLVAAGAAVSWAEPVSAAGRGLFKKHDGGGLLKLDRPHAPGKGLLKKRPKLHKHRLFHRPAAAKRHKLFDNKPHKLFDGHGLRGRLRRH